LRLKRLLKLSSLLVVVLVHHRLVQWTASKALTFCLTAKRSIASTTFEEVMVEDLVIQATITRQKNS
jgi:hypothetical protein